MSNDETQTKEDALSSADRRDEENVGRRARSQIAEAQQTPRAFASKVPDRKELRQILRRAHETKTLCAQVQEARKLTQAQYHRLQAALHEEAQVPSNIIRASRNHDAKQARR